MFLFCAQFSQYVASQVKRGSMWLQPDFVTFFNTTFTSEMNWLTPYKLYPVQTPVVYKFLSCIVTFCDL